MYALWSQDADGDVTHLALSEDVDKLDNWVEKYCEQYELDAPIWTYEREGSPTLYAQANDMDWWIEPVEVL